MPRQAIILAVAATDAVQSAEFTVDRHKPVFIGLYPYADLGTDTAELQKQAPDDSWVQCTDDNGDIDLSVDRTMEVIYGPGTYRLNVPTRTASWGIWREDYF